MSQRAPGTGIPLGRILGIPIYVHPSWFIIFVLITLSLRTQFASQHPGWSPAQESYAQVAIHNTLTGVRAGDIMTSDVPTVPRDISLEEYVHEVLRTGRRCHVVTAGGNPVGLITLHGVCAVPHDTWGNTSIQAVMLPLDRIHSASPSQPIIGVLDRMQKEDVNQMPVASEGHIVGMITRDTILRFLQTRLQLGRFAEH